MHDANRATAIISSNCYQSMTKAARLCC